MVQRIVSREEWLVERRALLEEEKALTRARDQVSARRQALPWVLVAQEYAFDSERGRLSLADLFGPHRRLIVQHYMFAPEWTEGCRSCAFWSDGFQGVLPHLAARDVAFVAVSEAPLEALLTFRERMGWVHPWVSAAPSRFSHDFHVCYTPAEIAAGETAYNYQPGLHYGEHAPGVSVFTRDGSGRVYHTYSCYARGLDPLNGTYQLLDLLPGGRGEEGLAMPMEWVRLHDRYE